MKHDFCVRRFDYCEVAAEQAREPEIKAQWTQLAIEWHLLASRNAAQTAREEAKLEQ